MTSETTDRAPVAVEGGKWAIALLLLGSGLCSLVYQTVWLREMRGVFGSSTAATAAVIGIFMGGLGLGGFLFGRRADRHGNPLRLYSFLEFGVSLSALATIPLVTLIGMLYVASGGSLQLGTAGATLLRLVLAILVLGIPTVLMGGTLPAMARVVVVEGDVKRRALAALYGVNTVGAVVGTLASTFFALEIFGNRQTLVIAVLLNMLIALTARSMSRLPRFVPEPAPEGGTIESESTESRAPRSFTLIAAAVTGFTFFLLELVWYRMLAPILGGTTFTFGVILAMALLGIGLGGLLYALMAGNREATLRLFAVTCGLEALAIVAPFAAGDRIAVLAILVRPFDVIGFQGNIFSWSLISAIVVLPAAIVAGFQFPVLVALAGRGARNVGVDVGRVYALNTFGAICGSLAGGFGLMPLLSAPGCWALCGWLMVGLCAFATLEGARRRSLPVVGPLLAAAAAVPLLIATGPTATWRHLPIGAGRASVTARSVNELVASQRIQRSGVVMEAEGVESSVAIIGDDGYAFLVNGKSDGHSIGDAPTQVMGGLLGAILHPQPKRSLVVGLGTGSTPGWLARVPGMERVDVAELEPEIRRVADACAPVNQRVLEQPNVKVFYGDAREFLLVSRDRYDVVFSEPSNPYRAGIAGLFTVEFYEAVRDRLANGGIFLQWVQAYEIDGPTLDTIVKTLRIVFPHIQIWQTVDKDLVLMASREPVPIDAARVRSRVAVEPYRTALRATWKTDSAEGFLAHHIADPKLADLIAGQPRTIENTDDRNVVEFGFARHVGRAEMRMARELRTLASRFEARDGSIVGNYDRELVQRFRSTSPLVSGTDPLQDSDLARSVTAYEQGSFREVTAIWTRRGLEPQNGHEILMVAESLAQAGDARCLDYLERLRAYDPIEPLWVEAIYRHAIRAERESALLLARGFELRREWPWTSAHLVARAQRLAETLLRTGDDESAMALQASLAKPFAVGASESTRRAMLLTAAVRLEPDRCGPRTLAALHLTEPHSPWVRQSLELRARCYADARDPLAPLAQEEFNLFLDREPQGVGLNIPSGR